MIANIDLTFLTQSDADLILLTMCPCAAGLGTLVAAVLAEKKIKKWFPFFLFLLGRLFVGMVLGVVIALYLTGMIKAQTTDLARVLALCVLAGYQAPNLWFSQERLVKQLVESELKKHSGASAD